MFRRFTRCSNLIQRRGFISIRTNYNMKTPTYNNIDKPLNNFMINSTNNSMNNSMNKSVFLTQHRFYRTYHNEYSKSNIIGTICGISISPEPEAFFYRCFVLVPLGIILGINEWWKKDSNNENLSESDKKKSLFNNIFYGISYGIIGGLIFPLITIATPIYFVTFHLSKYFK